MVFNPCSVIMVFLFVDSDSDLTAFRFRVSE